MAQAKWVKVGAAAVLSASMLAACGDTPDQDEEVEIVPTEETDPETDTEDDDDEDSDY